MDWLNYHHLQYFYAVAREGSLAAASDRLSVSQPTISTQIKQLEGDMGTALFEKRGRSLELTEAGLTVLEYAETIFSTGQALIDAVNGQLTGRPRQVTIGVSHVVPKPIAFSLIKPAVILPEPVQITVEEGRHVELLAKLSTGKLDMVLADAPIGSVKIRGYNHLLGESSLTVFAHPSLKAQYEPDFPESLNLAPFLMPMEGSVLRASIEGWFGDQKLTPRVIGQFDDSSLLKTFGQEGIGLFASPTAARDEIMRQYNVLPVGEIRDIQETYYAITTLRRPDNPALVAMLDHAKEALH